MLWDSPPGLAMCPSDFGSCVVGVDGPPRFFNRSMRAADSILKCFQNPPCCGKIIHPFRHLHGIVAISRLAFNAPNGSRCIA
jgi:hypothetical protein